nr:hypothetical protein [Oxalobacteraceae bacterium]
IGDIDDLPTGHIQALSSAAISGFTTSQLDEFTSAQLASISAKGMAGFEAEDWDVIEADFSVFSAAQIKGLQAAQMDDLPDSFFNANTSEIASLTQAQILGITTAVLRTIDLATFKGFANKQLSMFTAEQVAALNLNGKLINQSTPTLTSTQEALLNTSAITTLYLSPIVLDLDGNGVRTVSLNTGVRFDMTADGNPDRTGWVSSGDGLLARDISGDGLINNSAELFGDLTKLADGSTAGDGYQALAELDVNRDGRIDVSDPVYNELRVWQDSNQDGVSQADELRSLADAGVASIDASARPTSVVDQGNWIGLEASFTRSDGSSGATADVWFKVQVADAMDERAQQLGDVLGTYESDSAGKGSSGSSGVADVPKSSRPNAEASLAPPVLVRDLAAVLQEYTLHDRDRHALLDAAAVDRRSVVDGLKSGLDQGRGYTLSGGGQTSGS